MLAKGHTCAEEKALPLGALGLVLLPHVKAEVTGWFLSVLQSNPKATISATVLVKCCGVVGESGNWLKTSDLDIALKLIMMHSFPLNEEASSPSSWWLPSFLAFRPP